jgi:hypothetical protein
MTVAPVGRKRIAVFPASKRESEGRLLASLAELYPVDFVGEHEIGLQRMDAAIFFPEAGGLSQAVFERGVSSFRFVCGGRGIPLAPKTSVVFSPNAVLHPALRNAQIPVGCDTSVAELSACDGDVPLAQHGSAKFWQFRVEGKAELHTNAVTPPELRGEQFLLWSWLRPDNWAALLPLMHFLRRVTEAADWSPAPTQACFMFDDPNLHSVRYGYLDFPQVAHECLTHKYHVAVATVPLDTWYAAPAAVGLFRRNRESLSLLIHGNDHVANELGRERSPDEALRLLAQALKRVDRFERRTGLRVGTVIAPPHGGCSESMLAQMLCLPFEGVCTSVGSLVHSYKGNLPLHFGLSPVSFLAGGFPMLRRWDLHYGLAPLRLAAFLGQPIIPYGHHQDCADGLKNLAEIAETVNSWGPTTWTDPESILRGHYRTKRDGELLHVQMWSRHVHVRVPEGISNVMVHVPFRDDACRVREETGGRSVVDVEACAAGVPVRVAQSRVLDLSIQSSCSVEPSSVGRPRHRVWPVMRRTLAIGRDRLTPILQTVRASAAARSITPRQLT